MIRNPIVIDGARVIGMTGDDDPVEHGGGVIFTNEDGAWWQFWGAREGAHLTVYTAQIHDNVLREASYTSAEELELLSGIAPDELKRMSRSILDTERAALIELLRREYGASAVAPGDPERLTKWELLQRWGTAYGIDADSAPRFELEDYIIIEEDGFHHCGSVAGTPLGAWPDSKDALIAISRHKARVGARSHVFWARPGDPDGPEYVDFNSALWALQSPRGTPLHRRPNKALWLRMTRQYRIEARKTARRIRGKTARRRHAADVRRRDIMERTRAAAQKPR
jgi:hypothetical protein